MYYLGFDEPHGARYVILPGDPGRVEKIASLLGGPRFHCQNREYAAWIGELSGERVLVTSTGIGGPSAAIAVEELYKTGVRTFLRVGPCGGMTLDVKGGDVVVATAAVRMEDTTREYVPPRISRRGAGSKRLGPVLARGRGPVQGFLLRPARPFPDARGI